MAERHTHGLSCFYKESAAFWEKTMTMAMAFPPLSISPSFFSLPHHSLSFPPFSISSCTLSSSIPQVCCGHATCARQVLCMPATCILMPMPIVCPYARIPLSSSPLPSHPPPSHPPRVTHATPPFSQVHRIRVVNSGVSALAQVSSGAADRGRTQAISSQSS